MKKIPLIMACMLATTSLALGQTDFERKVAERTCSCMEKLKAAGQMTEQNFYDCLGSSVLTDTAEVVREVFKKYGDTTDEHAHEFGELTTYTVMVNMVPTCDVFYHLMDSLRYSEFAGVDRDSLTRAIKQLEAIPEDKRDLNAHVDLASSYFLLKQFDKAIPEIDKVLKLRPENQGLLFYMGFAKEMQGKYDEAIPYYQKAVDFSGSGPMKVFLEVAKRKKTGHFP